MNFFLKWNNSQQVYNIVQRLLVINKAWFLSEVEIKINIVEILNLYFKSKF